jgi:hypothetical protein
LLAVQLLLLAVLMEEAPTVLPRVTDVVQSVVLGVIVHSVWALLLAVPVFLVVMTSPWHLHLPSITTALAATLATRRWWVPMVPM